MPQHREHLSIEKHSASAHAEPRLGRSDVFGGERLHHQKRQIIVKLLRQSGLTHILEAENGAQALRRLKSHRVDVVITDWKMPSMTGLELLQAIRQDDDLKHLPVLMVTAEALKENILKATQSGADGYIVKPFSIEVLENKLTMILNRRGLLALPA